MAEQPAGWYPDPTDAARRRWWDGTSWGPHVTDGRRTWQAALEPPSAERTTRRVPAWAWVLIGVVALVVALLLAPVVALAAAIVLVTGIVALSRGTRTWLRLPSRRTAWVVTGAAAVTLLVSGSVSAAVLPAADSGTAIEAAPSAAPSTTPASRPRPTVTPTPTPVATEREETATEAIAFAETTVDDPQLPSGQSQVTTAGQPGERTLTYRVRLLDGVEVSRELISDTVTREPVTQVTSRGTYVAPPPPPPPVAAAPAGGGCHASYADACVPVDSDVDCAGGSGNGPSYFSGIARLVGPDVYDLDRDGDGYACEP